MRIILLVFALVPVALFSQTNRSANELARDNARDYITTKVFANLPYHSVSYTDLKPYKGKNLDITWTMQHRFEITDGEASQEPGGPSSRAYKFVFYLDRKLNIIRAESAYVE